MPATLEICVDGIAGLTTCLAAGVDRVELCSALDLGGLSPGLGLLQAAAQARRRQTALHVMVRPRAGDFIWSPAELSLICDEIAGLRGMGLDGVVIGANTADGALDQAALARMVQAAQGLHITLHRVVDLLPDPVQAVGVAARLGISRILSSGGAPCAIDGAATLARMVQAAAGRVEVMAGAGVTAALIPALARQTGATAFHASASRAGPLDPRLAQMGFASHPPRETDPARVQALLGAVRAL